MKDSLLVVHCLFVFVFAALADGQTHQIVIGAVPISAERSFNDSWFPTFVDFFNEFFSSSALQPVSFSFAILNLSSVFDAVSNGEVDFVFVNPSLFSCLDLEYSGLS